MNVDERDPEPCPHCGDRDTQRIVFGMLTGEGFREISQRRDLVAGGCVVGPYTHACPQCRTSWNSKTGEQSPS